MTPCSLPSPLLFYAHVEGYPDETDPHVVNLGSYTKPCPWVVCSREVLMTAATLPFEPGPTRGMEDPDAYKAREQRNRARMLDWAEAQGLTLYPDQTAARASIGEVPYDPERGDLGPWMTILNPAEHDEGGRLFQFQFGAMGTTFLAVWARSYGAALETAAEWLAEHARGHLIIEGSEDLNDLYAEARKELGPDASDDAVEEHATADLTHTESGYLTSYEWFGEEANRSLYERVKAVCEALHPEEGVDDDPDVDDADDDDLDR